MHISENLHLIVSHPILLQPIMIFRFEPQIAQLYAAQEEETCLWGVC